MEREKMIEEMAKDIKKILATKCVLNIGGNCEDCKYDNLGVKAYDCQSVLVADELTNQGYRKIPEGTVVLTKDEQIRQAEKRSEMVGEIVREAKAQVRKETASDLLSDISKASKVIEDIYRQEYHIIIGKEEVFKLKKKLKEKYGVGE